jgi:hypothetical protein
MQLLFVSLLAAISVIAAPNRLPQDVVPMTASDVSVPVAPITQNAPETIPEVAAPIKAATFENAIPETSEELELESESEELEIENPASEDSTEEGFDSKESSDETDPKINTEESTEEETEQ